MNVLVSMLIIVEKKVMYLMIKNSVLKKVIVGLLNIIDFV